MPLEQPAFCPHSKTLWTTSESPGAPPIHALCPWGKQTHKVYIHIYKHRNMNKKINSK